MLRLTLCRRARMISSWTYDKSRSNISKMSRSLLELLSRIFIIPDFLMKHSHECFFTYTHSEFFDCLNLCTWLVSPVIKQPSVVSDDSNFIHVELLVEGKPAADLDLEHNSALCLRAHWMGGLERLCSTQRTTLLLDFTIWCSAIYWILCSKWRSVALCSYPWQGCCSCKRYWLVCSK